MKIYFLLLSLFLSPSCSTSKGREIKSIETIDLTDNEKIIGFPSLTEYNRDGEKLKEYYLTDNQTKKVLSSEYFYSENKLSKISFYNPDKSKQYEIIYSYKNDTLRKELVNYISLKNPNSYITYEYEGKGETEKYYSQDNNEEFILQKITNYLYDDEGNLIQKIRKDNNGEFVHKITYQYNKKNQLICEDFIDKIYYEYNKQEDVVLEERKRDNKTYYKTTYKYSYDEYGNWTERKKTDYNLEISPSEAVSEMITRRKIEYYK